MKLGWPKFERAARRRARAELRTSKAQWKQYKRARREFYLVGWLALLWFIWIPALLLQRGFSESSLSVRMWPLALALYATGTVFLRAAGFRNTLYRSYDLAIILHLPAADQDFFWFAWKRLVRRSLVFFGLCLFAYGWFLWDNGLDLRRTFLVLAAAVAHWLTVILLTLAVFHSAWSRTVQVALALNGLAFVVATFLPGWALILEPMMWVLPAGWIHRAVMAAPHGGMPFALVVIVTGLLPLAVVGLSRLAASRYPESELELPPLEEEDELKVAEDASLPASADHRRARDRWQEARAAEGITRGGWAQAGLNWQGEGWVERLVARWLSGRQRAVAEFLLGGELCGWTWRWRKAAWISSIGLLATLALPFLPGWLLPWPLVVSMFMAMPLLGGAWPAFESRHSGTSLSPLYAVYPVVFSELSSVILKVNLVRLAAWLPLGLAYVAALCWRWEIPLPEGLGVAGGAAFTVIVAQPLLVAARVSRRTNDTRQTNSTSVALALVGFFGFFVFVSATLALFFVPLSMKLVAGGAMVLLSVAGWAFYGWLFNRGKMDMLYQVGGYGD